MINALFAVDHYGGMGYNGSLPWPHHAEDMARFQRLTTGHVVVMGSRSWNDPKMPKPLPNRRVYVASSHDVICAERISGDIQQAVLEIEKANPGKIIWIVGGPALIETCGSILDNIYLTHFAGSYKIDTKINLKSLLSGFIPVRAETSQDFSATFVKYSPLFSRNTNS
jgi:dihydrofolate reductase